jgi:hypothetical protein
MVGMVVVGMPDGWIGHGLLERLSSKLMRGGRVPYKYLF